VTVRRESLEAAIADYALKAVAFLAEVDAQVAELVKKGAAA
jgi:hypothetical protein